MDQVDIRQYPEVLEQLSHELSAGNQVELKLEENRKTGQLAIVLVRIDRKLKQKLNIN